MLEFFVTIFFSCKLNGTRVYVHNCFYNMESMSAVQLKQKMPTYIKGSAKDIYNVTVVLILCICICSQDIYGLGHALYGNI